VSVSRPVGIVVTDYHTTDELRGFCEALIQADPQVPYALMIAIIDSHGMESITAAEFCGLFSDRALVTGVSAYDTNIGFNVAANDGAKWLLELPIDPSGMTLAIFNSDTRILPGVIESCVDLLWSDEDYGAVGPRQISEVGKITAGGIFGTLDRPRHRGWQEPAGNKFTDIRPDSVTLSGSAYFVKAPVWHQMWHCQDYQAVADGASGAFLPCRHYYGETYCSYHMQAHGYKLVYNGEATMIHKWHRASPIAQTSFGEKNLIADREFFRKACDQHKNERFPQGIPHD
jgi:hypothetical protein